MHRLISLKRTALLAGGLLLAGLCRAQTTAGLRYGQSGFTFTKDFSAVRSNLAGIFAERELGKRFSLSTGLNYFWLNQSDSVYIPPGCFPAPGSDLSPIIREQQQMRLLEVPLDAGYSVLGKRGSRSQLKLTAGLSYLRVLRNTGSWLYESGRTEHEDLRGDSFHPANLFGAKVGLEEQIRFKQATFALGLQYRQGRLAPAGYWYSGNGLIYLKAGWQLRKRAVK